MELYLHDSDTATFKHYCFAYDLKDLAEKGLYFLEDTFNNKPPKHLTTFVDFVKEFINFASKDSMKMGVCCHEASHACDDIEDDIGMEHGGESSAYLTGWIGSCINKARLGIGDFVELKDKEE